MVKNHAVCRSPIEAPDHEAMMVGSTSGGSDHSTCMPYVNEERNVSLEDPLLVRSHDSADTVCCILMPDVKWSKITMWLTDRGS
jgi:hypothetical protein